MLVICWASAVVCLSPVVSAALSCTWQIWSYAGRIYSGSTLICESVLCVMALGLLNGSGNHDSFLGGFENSRGKHDPGRCWCIARCHCIYVCDLCVVYMYVVPGRVVWQGQRPYVCVPAWQFGRVSDAICLRARVALWQGQRPYVFVCPRGTLAGSGTLICMFGPPGTMLVSCLSSSTSLSCSCFSNLPHPAHVH